MKNGFDRPVDRSVELHLSLCLQQNGYPRVGGGLRDAGRGLAREARLSPTSPTSRVIGKQKTYHGGARRHGERPEDRVIGKKL
jgi:hypothetical protein